MNIEYGIGGRIEGALNSPEVQEAFPDLPQENIVTASTEVPAVPELRLSLQYTTEDYKPTPTVEKYLSKKNWKTFSLTGDGTDCVYVCCPKAPNSNFKCSGFDTGGIPEGLDEATKRAFAADTIVAITRFVAGLEASGCPVHDAPPAEPNAMDLLIADLTPQEIAAAVRRASEGA